jgi:hypothetical protein
MNDSTTQGTTNSGKLAALAVRLAGLWLLAGALAKLFLGTPKDLPEIVRKLSPFSLDLTFHLVIAVEFAIVWLALLKPRRAWPIVLALYAFFEFVLASQLAAGAESCGCFGASIKVSPYLMVAIDSALVVFLLATRPWKTIVESGARPELAAALIALSAALPWIVIRSEPGAPVKPGQPAVLPRYVELNPAKWLHKNVYDIAELTRWVPPEQLPTDGKIVLWRQGCAHCATHLRDMARDDDGSRPILLLQIRDDLKDSRAVDAMPIGPHVTALAMPENLDVPILTPWEARVEGGVVQQVVDPEQAQASQGH